MNALGQKVSGYQTYNETSRLKKIAKKNKSKLRGLPEITKFNKISSDIYHKRQEPFEISTGPSTPRDDKLKQLNGFTIKVLGDCVIKDKVVNHENFRLKFAMAKN